MRLPSLALPVLCLLLADAPASLAPQFAASIRPGPPPVITVNPTPASAAPILRVSTYAGWSSVYRAEPKTVTQGPTKWS